MTIYRIPYNLHDHHDHSHIYAPQSCFFDIEAESEKEAIDEAHLRRAGNSRIGRIHNPKAVTP